jgi:hypothetical protein
MMVCPCRSAASALSRSLVRRYTFATLEWLRARSCCQPVLPGPVHDGEAVLGSSRCKPLGQGAVLLESDKAPSELDHAAPDASVTGARKPPLATAFSALIRRPCKAGVAGERCRMILIDIARIVMATPHEGRGRQESARLMKLSLSSALNYGLHGPARTFNRRSMWEESLPCPGRERGFDSVDPTAPRPSISRSRRGLSALVLGPVAGSKRGSRFDPTI